MDAIIIDGSSTRRNLIVEMLRSVGMKKDSRLTFRVPSTLKKEVEAIAKSENQTAAKICEAFLVAGSEAYRRKGRRFLERYIGRVNWLEE